LFFLGVFFTFFGGSPPLPPRFLCYTTFQIFGNNLAAFFPVSCTPFFWFRVFLPFILFFFLLQLLNLPGSSCDLHFRPHIKSLSFPLIPSHFSFVVPPFKTFRVALRNLSPLPVSFGGRDHLTCGSIRRSTTG